MRILVFILFILTTSIIGLQWKQNSIYEERIKTLMNQISQKDATVTQLKNSNKDYITRFAKLVEAIQKLNLQQNIDVNTASNGELANTIKQDCKEDRDRYTACLTEYNTKMVEYQSCLSCKENNGFGCGLYCMEPHNNCNQYKPGFLCD